MLIPLAVASWTILLAGKPRAWRCTLAALWFFCFATFFNTWKSFDWYQQEFLQRMVGLDLIKNYYEHGGKALIPPLEGMAPLGPKLDEAKKLNISFYRKIRQEQMHPSNAVE